MNRYGHLEILELSGNSPREWGLIHGERFKTNIHEMARLRLRFMLEDTDFCSEKEVLSLAHKHLPILKSFDEDLYTELCAIAEGAQISPELVVVINHYTDMRDIRKLNALIADDGGCSVLYVPTHNGPILAQTWDVHGSATEHVFILKYQDAILFSVAGCLGMTGFNKHGVGVTINNLCSLDAQIGIVWPALVRKILKSENALDGRDVVMNATLGSGHHYVIADENHLFAIETSGTIKKITQDDAMSPHIHANHCLDPQMRETHTIRKNSTTFERFTTLQNILNESKLKTASQIYEVLGRVSMPINSAQIHQTATCGSLIMDLKSKSALASKGPPSEKFFSNPATSISL